MADDGAAARRVALDLGFQAAAGARGMRLVYHALDEFCARLGWRCLLFTVPIVFVA
jgi:hypothetical protein